MSHVTSGLNCAWHTSENSPTSHLAISFRPLTDSSEITSLSPLGCAIPLYSSVPLGTSLFMIVTAPIVLLLNWISWRAVGYVIYETVWHVAGTLLPELKDSQPPIRTKFYLKLLLELRLLIFSLIDLFHLTAINLSMTADELGPFQLRLLQ